MKRNSVFKKVISSMLVLLFLVWPLFAVYAEELVTEDTTAATSEPPAEASETPPSATVLASQSAAPTSETSLESETALLAPTSETNLAETSPQTVPEETWSEAQWAQWEYQQIAIEAARLLERIELSSDYQIDREAGVLRWLIRLRLEDAGQAARYRLAVLEPEAQRDAATMPLYNESLSLANGLPSAANFVYDEFVLSAATVDAPAHDEKIFVFETALVEGVSDYRLPVVPALLAEGLRFGDWLSLSSEDLGLTAGVAEANLAAVEETAAPMRASAVSTISFDLLIKAPDGTPISGADVQVKDAANTTVFSGTTNSSGLVTVSGLSPTESYTFTITASGYQPLNYSLPAGSVLPENLTVAPVSASTNPAVTSVSGVFDSANNIMTWTATFNTQGIYYLVGYRTHISLGTGLNNPSMTSHPNLSFSGGNFTENLSATNASRTYVFTTAPELNQDYFTVTTRLEDKRRLNKVEGTASATLMLVRVKTVNDLYVGETTVRGTASPNSTIVVKTEGGEVLGSSLSDSDGNYSVSIPSQSGGTILTIEANYNGSTGTMTTAVRDILTMAAAANLPGATVTTVSGRAAPGAVLAIKLGNVTLATTTADSNGDYSATLTPAQAAGTVLTVTATLNGVSHSLAATVTQGYGSVGGYKLWQFNGTVNSGMIYQSAGLSEAPLELANIDDKDYSFCIDPFVGATMSAWSTPYTKYYNGVGQSYMTPAQVEAIKPILIWAELNIVNPLGGDYPAYFTLCLQRLELYHYRSIAVTSAIYVKSGRKTYSEAVNLVAEMYRSDIFGPNWNIYDPNSIYGVVYDQTPASFDNTNVDYANSHLNIYIADSGTTVSQSVASATLAYRPTTFPFYLQKVDGQNQPITDAPATFVLTGPAPATTARSLQSSNGMASFTGLAPGSYSLEETVAPEGYALDSTPRAVVISNNGDVAVDGVALTNTPPTYNFVNQSATNGFINIHKKLREQLVANAPISGFDGVSFELRVSNADMTERNGALLGIGSNSAAVGVALTSTIAAVGQTQAEAGTATFTALPNGYYYLRESSRPEAPGAPASAYDSPLLEAFFKIENAQSYIWKDGAWKDASSDALTAADKTWGFDLYNLYTRVYPIQLQKVNSSQQTISSGSAFFEIYSEGSFTVDSEGKVTINIGATPMHTATTVNGLYTSPAIFTEGRYALLETRAPEGYVRLHRALQLSLESGEWKLVGTDGAVTIAPVSQGNAVQVVNRQPVYPQTGGMGSGGYLLGGILLIFLALALWFQPPPQAVRATRPLGGRRDHIHGKNAAYGVCNRKHQKLRPDGFVSTSRRLPQTAARCRSE